MKPAMLGGMDAGTFLRRHWQRKPLLVRNAFPAFEDPLSARDVLALSGSRDAQSRLVLRRGARWSLEPGPISRVRFKQLPRRNWTLLVQDTNHHSERADALLRRFDFIPHARVDDLMVSYAVPGGTVGPHVDSYDVFLLQGAGRRRWQIAEAGERSLRPDVPLKILERFIPESEWVLERGDLLYLPPGVAHYGVAETPCLTWSVGFRAPSDRELVAGFLDFLHDRLEPEGHYADPGAAPGRAPGAIPAPLERHAARALASIRWTTADVREFVGRHLSEPKNHVVFAAPRRPLGLAAFVARARRSGLALDARTRLLFSGSMFFLNGESVRPGASACAGLRLLANARRIAGPVRAPAPFWNLVHEWYRLGYLHMQGGSQP